jgi:hypothetical protein
MFGFGPWMMDDDGMFIWWNMVDVYVDLYGGME